MYRLINESVVLNLEDGSAIPIDPANSEYQTYLEWLSEGNQPENGIPVFEIDWQERINKLERDSYLNRGARELHMRLIEREAKALQTESITMESILSRQPYYMKLKSMDNEIKEMRNNIV